MGEIWIEGGKALHGEITIQGSKNAVLPMMAASLLQEGTVILHGCPKIADVLMMEKILQSLGAKTKWEENSLYLDCSKIQGVTILEQHAESMRSSVLLLGSMLVRKRKIEISYPGGCRIGKRPIDLHLDILRKMGACVEEKNGMLIICCHVSLQGIEAEFPFSSVGATENSILAAVGAKGISRLYNCAIEPEIVHLCMFLKKMGAKIKGIGTKNLEICGGAPLSPVEYQVPADRIVAGTYLYAAAASRGNCVLHKAPIKEMQSVLSIYEKMGGQWEYNSGKLKANAENVRFPVEHLQTASYPGFPTDMQSILMSVLLTIPGKSCICESIFENRFQIVPQLQRMGGKVWADGNCAWIEGGHSLEGKTVEARELRGGAALVVAGLTAKGITRIQNAHYIERGYEELHKRIQELNGKIWIEENR